VDVALQFIRSQHHHDVGPLRGFGDFHHLEAGGFRLLRRGRPLAQRNGDVLDAGVLQVQRMGVALAAVANDADLLSLDQIEISVAIVIDTHGRSPFWWRLTDHARLCVKRRRNTPTPLKNAAGFYGDGCPETSPETMI